MKDRTTAGPIKGQFRVAAAKVIQERAISEPQTKTRRRRSGEDTRDPFPVAARTIARRRAAQPVGAASTSTFLSDTLDWLNFWHQDGTATSNPGGGLETTPNHISFHL